MVANQAMQKPNSSKASPNEHGSFVEILESSRYSNNQFRQDSRINVEVVIGCHSWKLARKNCVNRSKDSPARNADKTCRIGQKDRFAQIAKNNTMLLTTYPA